MSYAYTQSKKDPFAVFLTASIAVHLTFFVATIIKIQWFPSDDVYIQSAIKVDMVALPEKQTQKPVAKKAPKKAPVKTPLKKKTPPQKKVKPKKIASPKKVALKRNATKKAQQDALRKLQQQAMLDRIKNDVSDTEEEIVEPPQPVKGNIISNGGQYSGLDKLQFDAYYDQITQHVKTYWSLPQWLASANLQAEALVQIDARGYVVRSEIYKSSNNSAFDSVVLNTIKNASPFPPPTGRMAGKITRDVFVISFP